MNSTLILLVILFLAVLIDLAFLRWLRGYYARRGRSLPDQAWSYMLAACSPLWRPASRFLEKVGRVSDRLEQNRLIIWLNDHLQTMEKALFVTALLVYLATRLIGLVDFPIYFYCDEAAPVVLAADFVNDGWRNYTEEIFPTFFQNVDKYSLGLTVYLQLIPYLLFGKSVFVARATTGVMTLFAAAAIGLALKKVFKTSYWWAGPLLLAIVPTWFLHSRTAFETATLAALYAGALYFYLRYRCHDPRYLYPALTMAALAFYTYSPGQVVIAVTTLVLIVSDFRYHWQNRAIVMRGLGLLALLALPYLRFWLKHSTAPVDQLHMLNSYWIKPIPLGEKLTTFGSLYSYYSSPFYWYLPHDNDLVIHTMKGYGHLWWISLPFALIGFIKAVRSFRIPSYRLLVLCLLASPVAGSLVEGPSPVTRCMSYVIPATLLAALGWVQVLEWLEKRLFFKVFWNACLFFLLAVMSFIMLGDALVNGPTWFQNYYMDGMQYGATQMFSAVNEIWADDPQTKVFISPNWGYYTHHQTRFFLSDKAPYRLGSVGDFFTSYSPIDDLLFVLPAVEFQQTLNSGRFTDIHIERVIPYPNGQPGFFFFKMRYVDNIQQIFEEEKATRRKLVPDDIVLDDVPTHVEHTQFNMNTIGEVFDGDLETLVRTADINPVVIDLEFSKPRLLKGYYIKFGTTKVDIVTTLYKSELDIEPMIFSGTYEGTNENPGAEIDFGKPLQVKRLHLEIHDTTQGETGPVHVWEITFQ